MIMVNKVRCVPLNHHATDADIWNLFQWVLNEVKVNPTHWFPVCPRCVVLTASHHEQIPLFFLFCQLGIAVILLQLCALFGKFLSTASLLCLFEGS